MQVFAGIEDFASSNASGFGSRSVLTIGNFDGVHIGHQELIRKAVERARSKGIPSVVFTFEPHPVMVLRPELKLKRLFDPDDRREQLERLGVDCLVIEPFSRAFSQLPPERFLAEKIIRPFQPETVVVGYDFSFGANRAGSIDFLKSHAQSMGFAVEVMPPVSIDVEGHSTVISSTRIRQALAHGQADIAAKLLGRPYALRGIVKKGAGRGRSIGIPTANLDPTVDVSIRLGVYAARAKVRGQMQPAMVNIGRNPTFVDSDVVHVEAHLPEYDGAREGDLYGEKIELHFITRIRDEMKFSGVEALVDQIRKDIQQGLEILRKS